MQKVLMIAFHYPPFQGGSGVHRTLKFSRYLREQGWQPIVLSAHRRAYPRTGEEQLAEIPHEVVVERAFAIDAARHLSVRGRYLRILALPDQWASWWWPAVLAGLKTIRRYRPSIIWSTYPIATAHLIGFTLQRFTGLPWIADFRDSMTDEYFPRDSWCRRSYQWIEKRVVTHASRLVFTASSERQIYLQRYPILSPANCVLIPNGYDEDDFKLIERHRGEVDCSGEPLRIVHSGLIYSEERDPRPFFRALSRLKAEKYISARTLLVDLRASGSEEYYLRLLKELKIGDVVRLRPSLPYRKALEDLADSDGLLLFQGASCNHQIPAKVYEYLRLQKPILALTPKDGDTGRLLTETGGGTIIDLDDEEAIYQGIPNFLAAIQHRTHSLPNANLVVRYSRRVQTSQLSSLLNELGLDSK